MCARSPITASGLDERRGGLAQRGFTLIEVMISMALLATALTAVLSNIYSLNQAQVAQREEAKVQILANQMIERVMGANFASLGKAVSASIQADQNAWSWQRRATPVPAFAALANSQVDASGAAVTTPINLPLAENVTDGTQATRDLVMLGIEDQLSGINGLRIYLEYYTMNILDDLKTAANAGQNPRTSWKAEVGDATLTDPTTASYPAASSPTTTNNIFVPESTNLIDLTTLGSRTTSQNDAVLVRIMVFWVSSVGGQRWHEVTVLRRK